MSYIIDNEKCDDTKCGIVSNLSKCQQDCPCTGDQPGGAIIKTEGDYSVVDSRCINCNICVKCCPEQAISEVE